MKLKVFASLAFLTPTIALAQKELTIHGWQMQDVTKVAAAGAVVSSANYKPDHWYTATVPGTVLTTLVDNKVYPEPLYGENMRTIPENLNKTDYWYRTIFAVPPEFKGRHIWLNFGGINYSAKVWVNGRACGEMRGAFVRGEFDITEFVKPGEQAAVAVLVSPQPHPGIPHEHTVALGVGKNGGETAIDGPTFLSTIGWDWLPAVRDRDTGIWLPVTLSSTGPVRIKNSFISSDLASDHSIAEVKISGTVENKTGKSIDGQLVGAIRGQGQDIVFRKSISVAANSSLPVKIDSSEFQQLHIRNPKLWWPNGYGPQNLSHLKLQFEIGKSISDEQSIQFGIRKIEYSSLNSENLTISVNGAPIMVRGGDWGLDEGLKRIPYERLEAQFHMHALANLNMIRNWVGQSTSPDFYDLADKYGLLIWDEFFQPNPNDGPDVTDIPTYMANVTDKVLRYRNHPSITVWCARNEGYPPKQLDEMLKVEMAKLDPQRLYQSNSADGRGVSSHGPYYWRAPRFFYAFNESFKTETGSVSIPTMESIQGMMPQKDWETINDDWAQHDMAKGAQRGDEFPSTLAKRYGHIRNLADFARKGAMATYESFRAMYEGRNAMMFKTTTGVLTWMSHPAQPSFVWQLYHYDLEPNAALYAAKKASEPVHIQLNEANFGIEVVNNRPEALQGAKAEVYIYSFDGSISSHRKYALGTIPASSTVKTAQLEVSARISPLYFVKLNLLDQDGKIVSTNLYWQNVSQEDFSGLEALSAAKLNISAKTRTEVEKTIIEVSMKNVTNTIALLTHLQLHTKNSGNRVLPVFYSDNYLSLVPGESSNIVIETATKDLKGELPLLLVDGYNVDTERVDGPVSIAPNLNANPSHWAPSQIVPMS